MPKKLRLSLGDLKVQSFVTALDIDEKYRLRAGNTACIETVSEPEPCSCEEFKDPTQGGSELPQSCEWLCTEGENCCGCFAATAQGT